MPTQPDKTQLESTLRARLPDVSLRHGGASDAVDNVQPVLVASPASQLEVAAVLAAASGVGAGVLPRGGGMQLDFGMPPERFDLLLDLGNVASLIEHEPADLTVTVEAGMALEALQLLLAKRGQWLPLDPHLPAEATIGGILATNASGPARIRFGTTRDLVIGMTVALPGGELVKSGGRVVKNVAGYDMAKLHIGALGTLGVITQASFKVAPLPPQTLSLTSQGSLDALSRAAHGLLTAGLPLLGLLMSKNHSEPLWRLHARFGGGASAIQRCQREAAAVIGGQGLQPTAGDAASWQSTLSPAANQAVGLRASVSPAALSVLAGALSACDADIVAYPGIGVVRASWPAPPSQSAIESLRQLCDSEGGALVLEKAPLEMKVRAGVWGSPRADFELMRRLKQEFDPHRVLNPGRFLGGI